VKSKLITRKVTPHESLHEFALFAEEKIPALVHNITILREAIPRDLKNPILIFLLNRTCNQVVEELILRLHEGWNILNIELKKLNEPILNLTDEDYTDLDVLRNKYIAHKVETHVYAKINYTEWYAENYGSYEKMFDLIERITGTLLTRVHRLEMDGMLESNQASMTVENRITANDIAALLNALKQAKLY